MQRHRDPVLDGGALATTLAVTERAQRRLGRTHHTSYWVALPSSNTLPDGVSTPPSGSIVTATASS